MAGKLQFTLQEYKDAARKWRSDFLRLPIIGCDETLKFMTGRPGIRYKESVGTLNASAQFAPYSPTRSEDVNLPCSTCPEIFYLCIIPGSVEHCIKLIFVIRSAV